MLRPDICNWKLMINTGGILKLFMAREEGYLESDFDLWGLVATYGAWNLRWRCVRLGGFLWVKLDGFF
ncbi:hypothetical protein QWA68_016837 [Fusarium oxysporum]|nr:hypothetical protein QWA68_016837 [Fusarium oxysporum]